MRTTLPLPTTPRRRAMAGISIVELMIAMVLGLLVLAALASLFANSSAARTELENNSRQIENGRFAIELLGDDLRLAGFYGEMVVSPNPPAIGAVPDPCSLNVADWIAAIPFGVQGYDNGAGAPGCVPADRKPGTDVLVVRRASTCEAGTAGCEPVMSNVPYVQVSKCSPQNVGTPYRLGLQGVQAFDLHLKNCTTLAGQRRYFVRIYYVSTDNGAGQPIPTLKRRDLTGAGWETVSLVEGIEELNLEYGIDWAPVAPLVPDGNPDADTADPNTFAPAGCTTCTPVNNWFNVTTVRINLLARNIDPSVNFTDNKTYTLGRDAAGAEINVTPGGPYRRHAYTGLVRVANVAQRRERPL